MEQALELYIKSFGDTDNKAVAEVEGKNSVSTVSCPYHLGQQRISASQQQVRAKNMRNKGKPTRDTPPPTDSLFVRVTARSQTLGTHHFLNAGLPI